MNLGMLWLDVSKSRSFDEKVARAAAYYRQKYGHAPNLCFVNSKAVSAEKQIGKINVHPADNILPHHFWLGRDKGKILVA